MFDPAQKKTREHRWEKPRFGMNEFSLENESLK